MSERRIAAHVEHVHLDGTTHSHPEPHECLHKRVVREKDSPAPTDWRCAHCGLLFGPAAALWLEGARQIASDTGTYLRESLNPYRQETTP